MRDINKVIVSGFFKELKLTTVDEKPLFDSTFDKLLVGSDENKNKLNTIMPLLNSVQLYCRYKQQYPESTEMVTFFHVAPEMGQIYSPDLVYRNVHWVFGVHDINLAMKFTGTALYFFEVPKQFLNSVVTFKN